MKGKRKHSKKLLIAALVCILCGCQRTEDKMTGTETTLPWELMSDDGTTNGINADIDTETGISAPDYDGQGHFGADYDGQGHFGADYDGQGHFEPDHDGQNNVEVETAELADEGFAEPGNDNFLTNIEDAFYFTELSEEIRLRITGKSYPDTEEALQISYEDLAYVHVLHYDFQMQVREGELICNRAIAQDLTDIFYELYENQYPIEKICLIDEYDADDEASMADNNTSCFNYRTVPGRTKLSNHAYGYAIDVNPLYNPYVRTRDGQTLISPDNAVPYADRSADFAHKIDKEDLCYSIFMEHGFSWGGAWNSSKDYQHFEKVP